MFGVPAFLQVRRLSAGACTRTDTEQPRTLGLPALCECFGLLQALARVPAWDTPQVRPCRLWRGIHAAQGPTPAPAQAPPIAIGCGTKCRGHAGLEILRSIHPRAMRADRWRADYIGHEVHRHQHVLEPLLADQRRQYWERGVASGGGTVWRHGCRHRASRDGFTACPDTGCGAAPPTNSAHRPALCTTSGVPCECSGLLRALAHVPAWDTPQVRPCRRWHGIHAAQGPTPARAQAPLVAVAS
ncbi:hypothetical protein FHT15_000464 [Xanthomonas campestris]